MKLAVETLSERLIAELLPLISNHYKEISHNPDIPLRPNWEVYRQMEEIGIFKAFVARDNFGGILGYVGCLTAPALHYMDSLQTNVDVIYLDPSHRGKMLGVKMIKFMEAELEKDGVQAIHFHVKLKHDFSPMLIRMGYENVEYVSSKRLF